MYICRHIIYMLFVFNCLGYINITPLYCDSISEGVCEKNVKRGDSVTLCITLTTTPSTIPQGRNAIVCSNSSWLVNYGNVSKTLCTCSRGSCKPCSNSSDVNYTHYSLATDNCLTVTKVQGNEVYVFKVLFSPISSPVSNVSFHMNYDHGELSIIHTEIPSPQQLTPF